MSTSRGKRGQNEGSITELADGRWQARLNLGYVNGKRARKAFYGKTKGEALAKLRAAQADVQRGLPLANEQLTVAAHLEDWLATTVKPNRRAKTYRSYEQNVRLYLIPALGRHKLAKLEPRQVQAFLTAQRAEGLSANSVQRMRDVLRNALNQALEWGLVSRNVAKLVKVPRGEARETRVLTAAQARQFLEASKGDRLESLYRVAVALGMRQGEILGLRWSDVDLAGRTLTVRKAMQRSDGGLSLVEPKSAQSRRVVDLPLSLVRALREHRAATRGATARRRSLARAGSRLLHAVGDAVRRAEHHQVLPARPGAGGAPAPDLPRAAPFLRLPAGGARPWPARGRRTPRPFRRPPDP
jgi:integrase